MDLDTVENATKLFEVGTICIYDLFESDTKLIIPDYQRPYVWNKEHITELLNDWNDHFFKDNKFNDDAIEYFMGSVMIHKNDGKYEVIDGQQRLTTLLIMDYVWNENNSVLSRGNFDFNYKSKVSSNHIKENRNLLKSIRGGLISKNFNKIIQKLVFSFIITENEDNAFVFFDSQNNRGVPLDEVDFFKSYHLRELNNYEEYLRFFAKKFDRINSLNNAKIHNEPNLKSLNELFIKQLWRIRFWSKNKLWFASRKSLLDTFQKNTVVFETVDDIKLYPSFNNTLGSSLKFNKQMQPELNSRIRLYGSESIDIPFTINQPIQKGIGFFLFTEKYTALFNYIFREKKVEEINPITSLIYELYNDYFINLYQMAVVMYYDKFGEQQIEPFTKWFEHFMGAFRMNRSSIVEQSPIVLLRVYGNILQLIQQSYLTSEVLSALKGAVEENYYEGFIYKKLENGDITIHFDDTLQTKLSPARQNYYQCVRIFYLKNITTNYQLTEKQNWINGSLAK
ncbi:DUF262 domain-containing protein [Chryseobacterium sp. BIGb0232]|uniref:DUF262 domain-containing protein n=1 Tax=Chryseobacterium sp. BIGb0232 TaxID=2940598 RepID=UPI000F471DA8|nr:DUF262 domain-containing protein [Chryseobacterium sp. BIGb0232]MCS4300612.1 hypothetical protein [Chryseobacterium sp. BIGb0232]ROS20502.1 uncharacterized protein with ParB-like and HNH nuclease domain [Chryseobacterium nakagawai]